MHNANVRYQEPLTHWVAQKLAQHRSTPFKGPHDRWSSSHQLGGALSRAVTTQADGPEASRIM